MVVLLKKVSFCVLVETGLVEDEVDYCAEDGEKSRRRYAEMLDNDEVGTQYASPLSPTDVCTPPRSYGGGGDGEGESEVVCVKAESGCLDESVKHNNTTAIPTFQTQPIFCTLNIMRGIVREVKASLETVEEMLCSDVFVGVKQRELEKLKKRKVVLDGQDELEKLKKRRVVLDGEDD
jgi:hypothetical protein